MALFSNDAVSGSLPTRFLSHANHHKSTELNSNTILLFPTDFPYEFDSLDSVPSSSPVDPDLASTDSVETTVDEVDFLAALTLRLTRSSTRKFEKSWMSAESPLSGIRSMSISSNGIPNISSSLVSSPPTTTPFGGQSDTWGLISAAAGPVARLKTNRNSQARGLLAPLKSSSPVNAEPCISRSVNFDLAANTNEKQRQQVKRATWASCGGRQQRPKYAWHPLQEQKPQRQQRLDFVSGCDFVKRECAGTGVFLPRRYDNNPHDYGRKSDAMVERRKAVITMQKGSLRAEAVRNHHHEIHLPKEWTY